ncbi:MAG: carboxypeptidase-like regulatory domain-containing protein [Chitinophagaceae bacterium]
MKQQLQLHIPTPCHEKWDHMSPTEQGRFCMSCNKEVIDFSLMSDKEILAHISKASSNICGRASEDQLGRTIQAPVERRYSFKYFWSVLITSFLISNKSSAQVKPPKDNTVSNPVEANRNNKPVVIRMGMVSSAKQDINLELRGRVIDQDGKPIPYASVILKGTNNGIAADSNGIFVLNTIESVDNIELTASSVGYLRDTLSLANTTNINDIQIHGDKIRVLLRDMQLKVASLGEVVVRSESYSRRYGGLMAVSCIRYSYLGKIKDTLTGNRPIKVHPNPINRTSVFKIEFNLKDMGEYNLQCVDVSGRVIHTRMLNIAFKNQLENFDGNMFNTAGTYFVNIKSKQSAKMFTTKLMVQ